MNRLVIVRNDRRTIIIIIAIIIIFSSDSNFVQPSGTILAILVKGLKYSITVNLF